MGNMVSRECLDVLSSCSASVGRKLTTAWQLPLLAGSTTARTCKMRGKVQKGWQPAEREGCSSSASKHGSKMQHMPSVFYRLHTI